jgi:hypothetical protein
MESLMKSSSWNNLKCNVSTPDNPLIAYGLIGLIIGLILDTVMVCVACPVSALSVRYHDKHYYVVISFAY